MPLKYCLHTFSLFIFFTFRIKKNIYIDASERKGRDIEQYMKMKSITRKRGKYASLINREC